MPSPSRPARSVTPPTGMRRSQSHSGRASSTSVADVRSLHGDRPRLRGPGQGPAGRQQAAPRLRTGHCGPGPRQARRRVGQPPAPRRRRPGARRARRLGPRSGLAPGVRRDRTPRPQRQLRSRPRPTSRGDRPPPAPGRRQCRTVRQESSDLADRPGHRLPRSRRAGQRTHRGRLRRQTGRHHQLNPNRHKLRDLQRSLAVA